MPIYRIQFTRDSNIELTNTYYIKRSSEYEATQGVIEKFGDDVKILSCVKCGEDDENDKT